MLKDGRDTILRVRGEGGLSIEIVFCGARSWSIVRTMIDAVNLPGSIGASLPGPVAVRVDVCPWNPEFYNEKGPEHD